MPREADLESIAPLQPQQAIHATEAQASQSDGFIQQLQTVLLALAPGLEHGALAGGAEFQPEPNDSGERQQQHQV